MLAASVRAPDKTGHPFCGLKSQTAKAERFEDGSKGPGPVWSINGEAIPSLPFVLLDRFETM